jgi:hypothetical protein
LAGLAEDNATNPPSSDGQKDKARTKSTNEGDAKPAKGNTKKAANTQSDVASKTATFEKVEKTSEEYKTALDAHDLTKAKELADKKGAFKGKVAKVFEPRGGSMAIVNFDEKYQTALTALLRKENFPKFPDLEKLVGKEVVCSGKFIDFQGRAEIILTSPDQIRLVE